MARPSATLFCLAYLAWGVALQGCSTHPRQPAPPISELMLPAPTAMQGRSASLDSMPGSIGGEIAIRAMALLGAPYKYGGSGPAAFDCSGLVRFIHHELGIEVPRTAADQYRAATPVDAAALEPGDLLFFRTQGRGISHVAIYAGSGRFVHAPQTGRPIELRALEDDYYGPRLVGAGRLF